MLRRIIAFACGVLLCTPAIAAVIIVPDDHATIQEAIDAAVPGDTVLVKPGTYHENIDFTGKAVTVESEQGPAVTIIDGNQADTVVTFANAEGEDSVLQGFTVTNGRAVNGGGFRCGQDTAPTISGNVITANTVERDGAAIFCNASSAVIVDNTITANASDLTWAGAIAGYDFSSPTISGNTISNNPVSGIESHNNWWPPYPVPIVTITDNVITGNTCVWHGAGIHLFNARGYIENNIISDNAAGNNGGGIYLWQNKSSVLHNTITNNTAGHSGGGICCFKGQPILSGNVISGNSSVKKGGGISCRDENYGFIHDNTITENTTAGNGGGIQCGRSGPWILSNRISENEAEGFGGGIHLYYSSPGIADNLITRNASGDTGGGISCNHFSYYFSNVGYIANNIIANNAAVNDGGGICAFDQSWPRVVNNTITRNSASRGGAVCCLDTSYATIANTIIWRNNAASDPVIFAENSGTVVHHSDVEGGWPGTGNIEADPLLADPSSGDYHLTWDSPCIAAGDATAVLLNHDFENDPREGDLVAIGADEYAIHLYHIGDVVPGGAVSIRTVGEPGDPVLICLGSGVQDPPQPTRFGDLYLLPPIRKKWSPDDIPAGGILIWDVTLPGNLVSGEQLPLQAIVGPLTNSGGELGVLTNLLLLTVE